MRFLSLPNPGFAYILVSKKIYWPYPRSLGPFREYLDIFGSIYLVLYVFVGLLKQVTYRQTYGMAPLVLIVNDLYFGGFQTSLS